ncbi:MAG TPA: mandelate racemase/muconate lactonizing enzyme family protein [Ilumatobacter sp.]|nr:mandelate racemase/muconate lactonizing enzyme family protein [Ilumatobacter sp.]
MRITAVETVRLPAHPEYLWVRLETDEGLVGTGETMPRVGSVERVVHDVLAPVVLGADVAAEAIWTRSFETISYHGYAGAELRALSAIDIAVWDLVGQAAGLPVHRLLGGPCRDRIPAYNSCASTGAIRDHERFTDDPVGLARELIDEAYPAMKIWPFDVLSTASDGQRIDRAQLLAGCRAFGAIRDAVGDQIDIALEGHSCWGLPAAISIATALEEFHPMWLEDMLHARRPEAWAQLRESTSIPLCGSERAFTRWGIAPYLDAGAVDVVNQDLCWTGGFTEFTKVAALAALHELPVAPPQLSRPGRGDGHHPRRGGDPQPVSARIGAGLHQGLLRRDRRRSPAGRRDGNCRPRTARAGCEPSRRRARGRQPGTFRGGLDRSQRVGPRRPLVGPTRRSDLSRSVMPPAVPRRVRFSGPCGRVRVPSAE